MTILSNINKININNLYDGNKFLFFYKKYKNDYGELLNYMSFISIYNSLLNINNINLSNSKNNLPLINLNYHTKYNNLKQDKAYYFNNLNYNININTEVLENLTNNNKFMNETNLFTGNSNILNSIIDIDIINYYNNNGLVLNDIKINNSIFKKLEKIF